MDFTPGMLFAGFVFGVFGGYLFKRGKKLSHFPFIVLGIAMFIFPYFVHSVWLTWTIGGALLGAAYLYRA